MICEVVVPLTYPGMAFHSTTKVLVGAIPCIQYLIVPDVALKSLLFGMVFYIINSKLLNKLLSFFDKYPWIEKNFIQSILFVLVFYFISINL